MLRIFSFIEFRRGQALGVTDVFSSCCLKSRQILTVRIMLECRMQKQSIVDFSAQEKQKYEKFPNHVYVGSR